MNHPLITPELIETIQEGKLRQAQRRRLEARRLVNRSPSQDETLRMALGPGTQFVGVTERVLDTATKRNRALRHRFLSA